MATGNVLVGPGRGEAEPGSRDRAESGAGVAAGAGSGIRARAAHTKMLVMAEPGRPLGAWS